MCCGAELPSGLMVHCARRIDKSENTDLSPWDGQVGLRASRDSLANHFQIKVGLSLASLRKTGLRWS